MSGEATGYGEYAAGTMMDTLYGDIETFESRVERLEQLVGKELSPQIRDASQFAGDLVNSLAALPEEQFSALVSGLEVIALAGPGLMLAGGAFRLLGHAFTFAGGIPLMAVELAAIVAYIDKLTEIDFKNKFGTLELDESAVSSYIGQLAEDFRKANENAYYFGQTLQQSVENYKSASSDLSGTLLTNMLTGVKIDEESQEYKDLFAMGEKMIQAVEDGIESSYSEMGAALASAFTGTETAENVGEGGNIWAQIMGVLEQGHAQEVEKAKKLGQELRDALTEAFKDGNLTSEEFRSITEIQSQMEELLAMQQDRELYKKKQAMMRKSRTLGLDAITKTSTEVTAERDRELEELLGRQDETLFDLTYWYDQAIKNGWMVDNTDGTEGQHVATEADKQAAIAAAKAMFQKQQYDFSARFNQFLMDYYTEGIMGSDFAESWTALQDMTKSAMETGGYITPAALNAWREAGGGKNWSDLDTYLNMMMNALGGIDQIEEYANYYAKTGNKELADQYRTLLNMYNILGGPNGIIPETGSNIYREDLFETDDHEAAVRALIRGNVKDEESANRMIENIINALAESSDEGTEQDWEFILGQLYSPILKQSKEAGASSIEAYLQQIFGKNEIQEWAENGITFSVHGDTTELEAVISESDGQTLMEYIDGDATNLQVKISDENGKTLKEFVTGDTSTLAAQIAKFNGQTIRVNIRGQKMFAEGGRATEPSIFGEEPGQAEWAIPEKHDSNTKSLLNAARAASGFTWPEIMGGGGGGSREPMTVIYSPTIHANDTTGVSEALKEDKKRLEEWFRDRERRERMEVYA